MRNNRIAKRVYVGESVGSRSVGRQRKRWNDTVKVCLKKRCLDVRQARIVWRVIVKGDAWAIARGMNP